MWLRVILIFFPNFNLGWQSQPYTSNISYTGAQLRLSNLGRKTVTH